MSVNLKTNEEFPRGAIPSSRGTLAGAIPFKAFKAIPPQLAVVPKQLSMWGNEQYGDCVTAEEAFKCACDSPEDFIPDQNVIDWAASHNVLNGANLLPVMQAMQTNGFRLDGKTYGDGQPKSVDYTQENILQAAIASGPVKIAIDANALPQGAGNQSGWYSFAKGPYPNTDHCVALCGYGPASFLFASLNVPLPAGIDPAKPCYLLYTWSTIGVVDHEWLLGTCVEAWVRQPNTIINPPPTPVPPVPPIPPVPPVPPAPGSWAINLQGTIVPGSMSHEAIGPILLAILKALCLAAPMLPPPYNAIAMAACSLIPPGERDCNH